MRNSTTKVKPQSKSLFSPVDADCFLSVDHTFVPRIDANKKAQKTMKELHSLIRDTLREYGTVACCHRHRESGRICGKWITPMGGASW